MNARFTLAALLLLAFGSAHAWEPRTGRIIDIQAQHQGQQQGQQQGQHQTAQGGHAAAGAASASQANNDLQLDTTLSTGATTLTGGTMDASVTTGATTLNGGSMTGGANMIEWADESQIEIGGDTTIYEIPVAAAYAPTPMSNSKCQKVLGFGWNNGSASGSIGAPLPTGDCWLREDAKIFSNMGMRLMAAETLCHTKQMRNAFGADAGKGKAVRIERCIARVHETMRIESDLLTLRTSVQGLNAALEAERGKTEIELQRMRDEFNERANRQKQAFIDGMKK